MTTGMLVRRCGRWGAVAAAGVLLSAAGLGCIDTTSYHLTAREQGIADYKKGDYGNAAGSFQNALRHEPRDYRSMYYLASSHDAQNLHQQALSEYRTALDIMATTHDGQCDPEFRALVLDGYAKSIAKGEDRDTQLNQLEQTARSKNDAESHFLVAKVYQYSGDADNALVNFAQAARLDPRNARYASEYNAYRAKLGGGGGGESNPAPAAAGAETATHTPPAAAPRAQAPR